jgi:hypothetical protein
MSIGIRELVVFLSYTALQCHRATAVEEREKAMTSDERLAQSWPRHPHDSRDEYQLSLFFGAFFDDLSLTWLDRFF